MTYHQSGDLLGAVEAQLDRARDALVGAVDRVDALVDLRGWLMDIAAEQNDPAVTPWDLVDAARGAEPRARLRALLQRALPGQDDLVADLLGRD